MLFFPILFVWIYSDVVGAVLVSVDPAVWGQFGDFLSGAINSFVGFVTVMLLLYAIIQNHSVLTLTKTMVADTSRQLNEMRQTNDAHLLTFLCGRYDGLISEHSEKLNRLKVDLCSENKRLHSLLNQKSIYERCPPQDLVHYENVVTSISETEKGIDSLISQVNWAADVIVSCTDKRSKMLKLLHESGDRIIEGVSAD